MQGLAGGVEIGGNVLSEWLLERWRAPAGVLHARPMPAGGPRRCSVLEASRPAVVLGSSQRSEIDAGAAAELGLDVVRRRSGGGAVLLDEHVRWVDLFIPSGDPLWRDDVGHAALWVGDLFAEALRSGGVAQSIEVAQPPLRRGAWGREICYSGVGPGEVLVGGRKLVGIAQRRTRHGARFQCSWYAHWAPGPLLEVLRPALMGTSGGDRSGPDEVFSLAAVERELGAAVVALDDVGEVDLLAEVLSRLGLRS